MPAVSAKIFINEIDPNQGVVELYNSEADSQDLTGWKITADSGEEITVSGEISSKDYLLRNIFLDSAEDKLVLYNGGGEKEDELEYTYNDYQEDENGKFVFTHTYGRYPDGTEEIKGVEFKHPSLGGANFNVQVSLVSQEPGEVFVDTPEITFKAKIKNNEIHGFDLLPLLAYTDASGNVKNFEAEKLSSEEYQFKKSGSYGSKGSLVKWQFLFSTSKDGESTELKESAVQSFTVKNSPPVLTGQIPLQATDEDIGQPVNAHSYFSDGDGDALSFEGFPTGHLFFVKDGQTLIIVPEKNWFGETSAKILASDGESSVESNLFTVKVNSINDAPTALWQEISTTEDAPVEITLGSIDIDTEEASLAYKIVDAPQKGTLSGSGQKITYTPNPNANGADTFTFLVDDGEYTSAPATVTVNIASVADAPKFTSDSFKVEMYEDSLKAVGLNNYLTDADTPLNDLTFNYNGQEPELNFKLDEAKNELYITSLIKDWFGEKKVFLTVFDIDGVLSDTAEMTVKVNQLKDDAPTISSFYPFYDVALGEDKTQEFKMELNDPDSINPKFEWYVDGKKQSDADNTFLFDAKKYSVTEHKIKGKIVGYALEKEWKVKLVDKPVFDKFNGATTDLSKLNQVQLKSVNLVLEKLGYGKIVFDTPVDLTEILDLNNVVEIGSNLVAVDTANAPSLNVPATVTLYKVKFNNPVVLLYDGFTSDASLINALCSDCQVTSKGADSVTFKTKHFSALKLVESTSLQLNVPSAVSFAEGERGATVEAQFELANAGTSVLSNLKISSTAASQYGAVFSLDGVTYSNTVILNSLNVGMIKTIFVKATVPANIDSGWQDIGDILIVDTTLSKTIGGFYLKAKDYLTINEIKVNGKTDGELVPGEINEIKVVVENVLGDGDLEDIEVKATLFDIGKKDLDEEESSFDLKAGASKKVSFEFELPYDLEEKSYELEVEAIGETKEGAEIEVIKTFKIDVKREGHQIIISSVKSLPAKADFCDDETVLIEAELVNTGSTTEKDLSLKLQSGGKVWNEKSGLLLEKYSGKSSQKTTFEVETTQLKEGKNIFILELSNSKNVFDTKEFVLKAEECVKEEAEKETAAEKKIEVTEDILPTTADGGKKSQQKLTGSTVLSVRETQEYLVLVLLGIVIFGAIILLLLGLFIFPSRRK